MKTDVFYIPIEQKKKEFNKLIKNFKYLVKKNGYSKSSYKIRRAANHIKTIQDSLDANEHFFRKIQELNFELSLNSDSSDSSVPSDSSSSSEEEFCLDDLIDSESD